MYLLILPLIYVIARISSSFTYSYSGQLGKRAFGEQQ